MGSRAWVGCRAQLVGCCPVLSYANCNLPAIADPALRPPRPFRAGPQAQGVPGEGGPQRPLRSPRCLVWGRGWRRGQRRRSSDPPRCTSTRTGGGWPGDGAVTACSRSCAVGCKGGWLGPGQLGPVSGCSYAGEAVTGRQWAWVLAWCKHKAMGLFQGAVAFEHSFHAVLCVRDQLRSSWADPKPLLV